MTDANAIDQALARARGFAARGDDDAARQAYVDVLRLDQTHFAALNELGTLAYAGGYRSAARTAWRQAVLHHPNNPMARINLANLLAEDGDSATAQQHLQAVLDIDPAFPEAHQGLARLLGNLGDPAAEQHWQQGFHGHAVVTQRYRGVGSGVPILLLVSARRGNIKVHHWINDRLFAVTAIYADFWDPAQALPPHALVMNAIGDADLCGEALSRAETMLAHNMAPVINPPAKVRRTGRLDNAERLAAVPGVVAPRIISLPRTAVDKAAELGFPLLLRSPGLHTGEEFVYVGEASALADAAATLSHDTVLAIQYLDARGPDGMARKYRVMFVDGVLYPLHLAISPDWKVHYFTAAMTDHPAYRDEERRFLEDMPRVLGETAMQALAGITAAMGLDYCGVDFALGPGGSLLLFEANATMVVFQPDADPIWDYRRPAITAVQDAVGRMLSQRIAGVGTGVRDL